MITRRSLLQGVLAAGVAPVFVKAEILMPVRKIIVPKVPMVFTGTKTITEIGFFFPSYADPLGQIARRADGTFVSPVKVGNMTVLR